MIWGGGVGGFRMKVYKIKQANFTRQPMESFLAISSQLYSPITRHCMSEYFKLYSCKYTVGSQNKMVLISQSQNIILGAIRTICTLFLLNGCERNCSVGAPFAVAVYVV